MVLNLAAQQKGMLTDDSQSVQTLLTLLRKNEHKNHRSLAALRQCPSCGKNVLFSGAQECEQCNAPINWPSPVRAMVCMDNPLTIPDAQFEAALGKLGSALDAAKEVLAA